MIQTFTLLQIWLLLFVGWRLGAYLIIIIRWREWWGRTGQDFGSIILKAIGNAITVAALFHVGAFRSLAP